MVTERSGATFQSSPGPPQRYGTPCPPWFPLDFLKENVSRGSFNAWNVEWAATLLKFGDEKLKAKILTTIKFENEKNSKRKILKTIKNWRRNNIHQTSEFVYFLT